MNVWLLAADLYAALIFSIVLALLIAARRAYERFTQYPTASADTGAARAPRMPRAGKPSA